MQSASVVGFSPEYVMLCCVAGAKRHYTALDKQTVCIAHTISGTLFVEDQQNLLFITTYTLQFHNTANITNRMPTSTNTRMKPNTTKELANHWCKIRTKSTTSESGAFGCFGRKFSGHKTHFLSVTGQSREKRDEWEPFLNFFILYFL